MKRKYIERRTGAGHEDAFEKARYATAAVAGVVWVIEQQAAIQHADLPCTRLHRGIDNLQQRAIRSTAIIGVAGDTPAAKARVIRKDRGVRLIADLPKHN